MAEQSYQLSGKLVWIAGHRGMVGSAVCRRLETTGCRIIVADRSELDLTRQADVEAWMEANKPQVVVVTAAKVGGIYANNEYPAAFIYENLAIGINVIEAARKTGVEKLLYLGSSCVYPRLAPQPISEGSLLTGALEPTNEWYAIAKIACLKLCQAYRRQHGCDFISAMPTNLFGPGDNYDLMTSHVVPALIRKCHEAKEEKHSSVEVWGSGRPRREFLYVDDLADALVFLLEHYSDEIPINVGCGHDIAIRDLAALIGKVVGFEGEFQFNSEMPDGTPRKLLDVDLLTELGWRNARPLEDALRLTYDAFARRS
jgi:GDP-L-fucose synthase